MKRKTSELLIMLIRHCRDDFYELRGYFILGKDIDFEHNGLWSEIKYMRKRTRKKSTIYKIINKNEEN